MGKKKHKPKPDAESVEAKKLYAQREDKQVGNQSEQGLPPAVDKDEPPSLPVQPAAEFDMDAMEDGDFDDDSFGSPWDTPWTKREPPDSREIAEQDERLRRRQREFRLAAEYVARAFAEFAEVQKVILFGSVAVPLKTEVPRFREYRRAGIAIAHECKDVDLAVWLTDLGNLRALGKARSRAVNQLMAETGLGVAHHQVDVFVMEPGTDRYLGRLCTFGECPKGKRECMVPGCGEKLFLQQHEKFTLRGDALGADRIVVLFERAAADEEEIQQD
jgi:hypothetical protein